ncbi:MAG: PaaI family thioesterase [Sulfurospirillaceae bacterium]|nr:PaaI family thioesterase [Sulfurospirillaceae bacterium]
MPKSKAALAQATIDNLSNFMDGDDDLSSNDTENALEESNSFLNEDLLTHTKIKTNFSGNLTELKKGFAKVILQTTNDMVVDEFGLIHNGFIFGASEYAAVAAINEENVVIIGCRSKFFAPAKLGDIIEFEAKGRFEEARKREAKVIGTINGVKVYEGIFQAVILEKHILQTKIDELQANFNTRDFS